MNCYIEHANIAVRDLDETIKFLTTALPDFHVRGGGDHPSAGKWCHVGTNETYIALFQSAQPDTRTRSSSGTGHVNHIGAAVDDVESVRQRLQSAGYKEGYKAETHPYRKRVYFVDKDGLEWEFVEYLTDDPARRNDYSQ